MTNYFTNCRTAEELKKEYKTIAKKLHPDCNPGRDTTKEFQEMQAEFSRAWDRLKNTHKAADGHEYQKETTETAREFMDLINKLMRLEGIKIEMIGSWIWVSGNTKEHKETLKACGLRFSSKKCAWFYHQGSYKKYSKNYSMDELRKKWGYGIIKDDADDSAA